MTADIAEEKTRGAVTMEVEPRIGQQASHGFDVSIVMAVYNSANYLRDAIDSVLSQDIGFCDHIQLILVDDGSSDGSSEICDEYSNIYPNNIISIHQENSGAAEARNEGLRHATGRYINFLDSDDLLAEKTVSTVLSYLENDNSIDIATVPIKMFNINPSDCWDHWQNFKFSSGTRVIDLRRNYQAPLMSASASFFSADVKDEIHFDNRLIVSEDNKVILTILAKTASYAVVCGEECCYKYRRGMTTDLVAGSKYNASWYTDYFTYLFDWACDYYRKTWGYVPAFVQYQLMCDLQWRILEDYDPTQILGVEGTNQYLNRLADSFKQIDDRYIFEQKKIYKEHRCFILSLKYGQNAVLRGGEAVDRREYPDEGIESPDGARYHFDNQCDDLLLTYGRVIASSVSSQVFEICFINIYNNILHIEGNVRTYGVSDSTDFKASIIVDNKEFECSLTPYPKESTARFGRTLVRACWFEVDIPLDEEGPYDLRCAFRLDGKLALINKPRLGHFMPVTTQFSGSYWWKDGWALSITRHGLWLEACSNAQRHSREKRLLEELQHSKKLGARKAAIARRAYSIQIQLKRKPIWLISDRWNRAGDNGEALFRWVRENHSREIDAYYVLERGSSDYKRLSKIGPVVEPLSHLHKSLYLRSDFVISSQADEVYINPFPNYQYPYADIVANKRFVFLQHGVIKDDLSGWLCRKDKNLRGFVTSATPEYYSVIDGDYGYTKREVWLTGLPRFDLLEDYSNKQKKRIITLMPTWRRYLMGSFDSASALWTLSPSFKDSAYRNTYCRLLSDSHFIDQVENLGCRLRFLPHPNLQSHLDQFEHDSRVEMLGLDASYRNIYSTSSLIITDYSSAVFDFVYMRKPIIYFQFDSDEFFSGGHVYTKGYFDYERDGFGEVEKTIEGLEERILQYASLDFKMKDNYRNRADSFFAFDDKNNCERVYNKLIKANEEDKKYMQ